MQYLIKKNMYKIYGALRMKLALYHRGSKAGIPLLPVSYGNNGDFIKPHREPNVLSSQHQKFWS